MGPTRSMRLPRTLDEWFAERLERHPERSPSEMLVQLIHGGLRLREGYMAIHRRVLEQYVSSGESDHYAAYVRCLTDTFGPEYVSHLGIGSPPSGLALRPARPKMGGLDEPRMLRQAGRRTGRFNCPQRIQIDMTTQTAGEQHAHQHEHQRGVVHAHPHKLVQHEHERRHHDGYGSRAFARARRPRACGRREPASLRARSRTPALTVTSVRSAPVAAVGRYDSGREPPTS